LLGIKQTGDNTSHISVSQFFAIDLHIPTSTTI
jgi:hypothetical protein